LAELDRLLTGRQANRQHLSGLRRAEQEPLLTLWKESANELIEQLSSIDASNLPRALSVLQAFVGQDQYEMISKNSSTAAVLTEDMITKLSTKLTEQPTASTEGAAALRTKIGLWRDKHGTLDTRPADRERNRFSLQFNVQATECTVPAPTSAPARSSIRPAAAIAPAGSAVPATATTSVRSLAQTDVASPPGGASTRPRTVTRTKNHASRITPKSR
jgi:hypothetical protein